MNQLWRITSVMLCGAAILLLSACQTLPVQFGGGTDGVFVHISHGTDQPHRALMGLQMAAIMADTKDVIVYFDIRGLDVVAKQTPDIRYRQFPSSKTQIAKLLEANVKLQACPGCMEARGLKAEDLIAGVEVAQKEAFFDFTKGRILTIDY